MREAQAVAKLNHPNIVSIYDIGKEDEKQFFVLEFIDGMNLRDLIETYPEGKCDLQTVLRMAIDICGALQYAHSQGVLHRDIKPENILITEGGDKDGALDYFIKAGEKAVKVFANGEAASYFQSALRLLEEKEGEFRDKACVLERLGDIKRLVGEYDASIKYWNEALLLWKQLDEKETAARLHRKMANVFWNNLGDRKKAEERHEEALKILEAMPESVELARLYEDMAEMVSMGATGDMAEALSWAEKSVELAKKSNAYEVIARSYACLGEISGWLGDRKKSIKCFEKALEIALDNGYMDTALWVYNDAGMLSADEHEKILEYLEKGFELAKKVGDISWMTWIGSNLAWTNICMGNINKAVLLMEESVALDRKAGNITHLSMSLDILGFAYQVLGEWDKSEQYRKDALSISQKLDDFQSIAGGYGHIGWLHFDRENTQKQENSVKKCMKFLKDMEQNPHKWKPLDILFRRT